MTPDVGIPRKKTMEFAGSTISYSYLDKLLTITTEQESITLDLAQIKELHAALKGFGLEIPGTATVNYMDNRQFGDH